jgi:hypothetical protein
MADGPFDPETGELIPRDPSVEDLVSLCRELHARGASFIVVGGFSIRAAGYGRHTGDIDLLIDTNLENEARVFEALATLTDGCARELEPGEPSRTVSSLCWIERLDTNWRATLRRCLEATARGGGSLGRHGGQPSMNLLALVRRDQFPYFTEHAIQGCNPS